MIKRPDTITSMVDDTQELTEGKVLDFVKDQAKGFLDVYHKAKNPATTEGQAKAKADAGAAKAEIGKANKVLTNKDSSYDDKLGAINSINKNLGEPTADALETIAGKVGKWSANTSSLVARSRKSVLQFPIYITQTLRVNEAHIIGKLFERVYASLVQTVMSQHPYITEDEANDLGFLKQFHTNLRESTDLVFNEYYTPIDTIDEIMRESVFYSEQVTPNMTVEFRKVPTDNEYLIKENARLINEPLTGLTYLKEDSKTLKGATYGWEEITPEQWSEFARAEIEKIVDKVKGGKGSDGEKKLADDWNNANTEAKKAPIIKVYEDKLKKDIRRDKVSHDGDVRFIAGHYQRRVKTKEEHEIPAKRDTSRPNAVEDAPRVPQLLKEADIKKINGMLPYQMLISFRVKTPAGGVDRDVNFIIGIKSVMHRISVQDLSEELRDLIMGNSKTLQKVRYKTGEITFMDYMFNIKGAKSDAAKRINGNKKWLNTLKRLGEYNKVNGAMLKKSIETITGGDIPIPNGTLVLSQSDITTLVNQTGIDLSVVRNAKNLAKTLFLIAVVIVDSTDGSMRVLFPDSDVDWDIQSLASIDAEIAKTDNSQIMRELNRMVNR